MTRLIAGFFLALAFLTPAIAEEVRIGDLLVKDAWVRLNIEGRPSAGYVAITNEGSEDDRLVAVSTPMAATAELHGHQMSDGQMQMIKLDAIEIAAGETVTLETGGLHVMLMGLVTTGEAGELIPLTFSFEKAGDVSTASIVVPLGAASPYSEAN